MKVFISYSRRDADFARSVYEYFQDSGHDVFTDTNNIHAGDVWTDIIETNISKCDVFAIIITFASIRSKEVEKEVLQAQRENKTIIPCIHRDVEKDDIKWDLGRFQGIEFYNEYDLARSVYSRIVRLQKSRHKNIIGTVVKPSINSSLEAKEEIDEQGNLKPKEEKTFYKPEKSKREDFDITKSFNKDNVINNNATTSRSIGAPIKLDYNRFRSTTTSIPNSSQMPSPPSSNSGDNKLLTNKITNIYTFVKKLGRGNIDDGQFYHPQGVELDSQGYVYVADTKNNRIQKFDRDGTFIAKWGSYGSGEGQFKEPVDIAVDSSGYVYVADTSNYRIQKFDSSGNFVTKWGYKGSADGQFDSPHGVAMDSAGNVYVVEYNNHRVQKFDGNGNFVTKWGSQDAAEGQFREPVDIAVDSSGNVYVTDAYNQHIEVFSPSSA